MMYVNVPFWEHIKYDDLDKFEELLEALQYIFIVSDPDHSAETNRVIRHMLVVVRRLKNMYDKIRATKSVSI